MKKKLLSRCLVGAPIGLAISEIITIVISLFINDGNFHPVVPAFIQDCGNEINAVLVQAILSLIYGAAFGGASAIWEKENWSILKQTVIHLIVISVSVFPIAYFCYWMDHNAKSVIIYFCTFFAIYVIIWLSQYSSMKKRIHEINEKISKENQ